VKRRIRKLVVYAILLAGSVLFMLPLLWMISTGLKPLDQTMTMPPVWLPYRLYVEKEGERIEVKRRRTIEYDAVEIVVSESGERAVAPAAEVADGHWAPAAGEAVAVKVVRAIPATVDAPWCVVRPVDDGETEWFAVPMSGLRKRISARWSNFGNAIRAMKYFPRYLRNTLTLCFLTVIGTVFSSAMAAYGFSRIDWRGRNKVFVVALATMMVPFPVVMVPLYCLFRALGWIGTLRPLWVGSFFAGAFNVFLLRQFFMTIPKDLSDAARVDGCSEFRIFWQIILPLSRPALMVVGLFQFMHTWNDFLGPLIYLTDQKDFTLALGLQFFQSQHGGTEWHYLMAASSLVALPVIVLFFFTQKTFIEGISMTGLKG